MSLPNSETLPENINELPPARQRHIRRQPRAASLAERQLLLESLIALTAPSLNFFLFSLLGALALGTALYFDDPAVLILALITLPFLSPAFGLSLLPASRKALTGLKSLISLLILFVLNFAAGVLAGYLRKDLSFTNLTIHRFSAPYWLDMALIGISAVIAVYVMVRKGARPRLIGVLLGYEILLPAALAGVGFPLGVTQLFPGTLWISLIHLGLAVILAALTYFTLSFGPKSLAGWMFLLLPVALIAVGLLLNPPSIPALTAVQTDPTATPSPTLPPPDTLDLRPSATGTATPQPPTSTPSPTLTHTPSPTDTQTPTQTPSAEPTIFIAIVDTLTGAVIRESPSFDAAVAGYLNDGDVVEILGTITEEGSQWYQVTTLEGQDGWLLRSLVNTQTPTPEGE
jgi:hypothetical protein